MCSVPTIKKKKVDCLNFDICHRREDLTTSSIVVSQTIYKYIWFAILFS
jgi:hypothetical protein